MELVYSSRNFGTSSDLRPHFAKTRKTVAFSLNKEPILSPKANHLEFSTSILLAFILMTLLAFLVVYVKCILSSKQYVQLRRNNDIRSRFSDKNSCPFDGRLLRLNLKDVENIIDFCDGAIISKGRFADDMCGSVHFSLSKLPGLGVSIALKDITVRNSNTAGSMKNEEVTSILRHFAVVPMFAKYESTNDTRVAFMSAFMANGDLEELLQEDNKRAIQSEPLNLPLDIRKMIMYQISQGIEFLHSSTENKKCVLHLDIKSANIFLDSQFNARLGDFGNARELEKPDEDDEVEVDNFFGTPGYFPKDQVSTISKKLDYFAFGITMLELLTGVNPCWVKPYRQIRLYQCQNLEGFIRLLHTANSRLTIDQRADQANVIYSTLDCSCADTGCIEQTCRDIVLKTQRELITNIPCGVVGCQSDLCTDCREFKQIIKTRINDIEKLKKKLESDNYAHECQSSHPEWLQDLQDQTQLCKCFNNTLSRLFKWGNYHKDIARIALGCLKAVTSQSRFLFENDVVSKLMDIIDDDTKCYWQQPTDGNCEICLINPAISGVIDRKMFVHDNGCRSQMSVCSECASSHYLNPVRCHSCRDGHPRVSGQNTAVVCIAGGKNEADIFLNDAKEVKQAFQDMFNAPDKYQYLISQNEGKYEKQIMRAFKEINENEDISTLIFFYSGHGSPGKLDISNEEEITEDNFQIYLKSLKHINKVFSYFDCCCPFTIKGSMLKCGSVKSFQYKAATTFSSAKILKERKQSIFTTLLLQVLKLNTEEINCFSANECKFCINYKQMLQENQCYIDSDQIFSYIEGHVNQGVDLTPSKASTEGEIKKEDRLFVPSKKLVKMQMRLRVHEQNIKGDVKYIDHFACVNPRSNFNGIRIDLFKIYMKNLDLFGENIEDVLHQYADVLCIISEAKNKECFNTKDLFEVWISKQPVNVSLRKYDDIGKGRVGIFTKTDEQDQQQHGIDSVLRHLFNKSLELTHTSDNNETLTLPCCEFYKHVELGSPVHGLSSYLKQRDGFEQTSITMTVPNKKCKFVCCELLPLLR